MHTFTGWREKGVMGQPLFGCDFQLYGLFFSGCSLEEKERIIQLRVCGYPGLVKVCHGF